MPIPEISKLVVPALNGQPAGIYALKDTYARQLLSGGIEHRVVWNGLSTPVVANIPDCVSIRYNDTVYTGTLPAENGQPMVFYLVKNTEGGSDNFAEYVVATDAATNTKYWEQLGYQGLELSNLGALAYMDSMEIYKGNGVNVIGENATLQASSSNVTFGAHTTDKVLGADTTFTPTDPVYSLTPTKGSISLSQTTTASLSTPSSTALTALDTNQSTKVPFIKADSSAFVRKKIQTTQIRGVTGSSVSATATISPVKHKLITDQFTPVNISNANLSSYVAASKKYLDTTTVTGVSGSVTASSISDKTSGSLATDTFYKVSEITANNSNNNEWKDTVANLDIHMYSAQTDPTTGVFAEADSETLVISYKTIPSVKVASTATTFATGKDGQNNDVSFVKDFTISSVTVPVANNAATTVATGSLTASTAGDQVVYSLTYRDDFPLPEAGKAIIYATGSVSDSTTADNHETAGGYVVTNVPNGSVDVPEIDNAAQTVLKNSTTNATNDSSDINVLTEVSLTGKTADAYTSIAFETDSFLTGASISTQPAFSASVTPNDNGDVVTGVTLNKTSNGAITAGTNDQVNAITVLGAATAAAQDISFANKDLKKVPLYDDLKIVTESHPAERYFNLTASSAGQIFLYKQGNPTDVELEISRDGVNWSDWNKTSSGNRVVSVIAGERIYIRNKSITSTGFSKDGGGGSSNHYAFSSPTGTKIGGVLESLLCKIPEYGVMSASCFKRLFYRQTRFTGNVKSISKTIPDYAFYQMFYRDDLAGDHNITSVTLSATSCGNNALTNWLADTGPNGTIYCPAELTLAENSNSGVPTGWTRVDI